MRAAIASGEMSTVVWECRVSISVYALLVFHNAAELLVRSAAA